MAKPAVAEVKPDTLVKANEVAQLKSALAALGLKVGDLDQAVKKDAKRGDLAVALIALCRKAGKKK